MGDVIVFKALDKRIAPEVGVISTTMTSHVISVLTDFEALSHGPSYSKAAYDLGSMLL